MPTAIPFELELLSHASRYQQWMMDAVWPYLGDRILEVGAGIGNMSRWLPLREKLVLSEAEPGLLPALRRRVNDQFGASPKVVVEQTDLSTDWVHHLAQYDLDTVISFNVLEHVKDDAAAIAQMLDLLRLCKGSGAKRLISVVPAHQWAYGSIDRSYQHFRRYSVRDFKRISREIGFEGQLQHRYFNVTGLPGWLLMNRVFKKKEIGFSAVKSFEKICPWIRGADDFVHTRLRLNLGQSLIVVMTLTPERGLA